MSINPETDLELKIISDTEFQKGINLGEPRPGHPEGKVIYHVDAVLKNIDKFYSENKVKRAKLRIVALLHDTYKHLVNRNLPKSGENHHGMIARRKAEMFDIKYKDILCVIQTHDDAYNAWQKGNRDNDWTYAKKKADQLIQKLHENNCFDLYVSFYHCDNNVDGKKQDNYNWFIENYCA